MSLSVEGVTRTNMEKTLINPPLSLDQAAVWLSEVFHRAAALRATDVHFFPANSEAQLWLRIDGFLHEACRYPRPMHDRIVARLKVLARCPDYVREAISEGRFTYTADPTRNERQEARLSIVPSLGGEKAVVRLFHPAGTLLTLKELGFTPRMAAALEEESAKPQGLLLVTGPAGSGKSTTLAAILQRGWDASSGPIAIATLEDPPEIPLPFATQVAVDAERGVTFASGLPALLRQDPEVLMVGEIRDPATAQVALNAALTGHRILSSLHTLNAAEALVRLLDMGVPAYVLVSAVGGVLSQRLVRRLCPHCRVERDGIDRDPPRGLPEPFTAQLHAARGYDPKGCARCNEIGYWGRMALGEWTHLSAQTVEPLMRYAPIRELERYLDVTVPAWEEAVEAVRSGGTSQREIERMFLLNPPGRIPDA